MSRSLRVFIHPCLGCGRILPLVGAGYCLRCLGVDIEDEPKFHPMIRDDGGREGVVD